MSPLTIAGAVFAGTMILLILNGNRVLNKRRKHLLDLSSQEGSPIREISYISYHGGLSDFPKAQKVTLAASEEALFLMANDGESAKLPITTWQKVEKFTTKTKYDPRQRSMLVWGPFNSVVYKDQVRHFITINYRDKQNLGTDNHILIEHEKLEQQDKIFEEIHSVWNKYRLGINDPRGCESLAEVPDLGSAS